MASREQFLDDYEISRLVCDSDDSEDDRHSDDDIGVSSSEYGDVVEVDLDDNIDSMYDAADTFLVTFRIIKVEMLLPSS
jgi:hypothetical protein